MARILVVEDDQNLQRSLKDCITDDSHEVETADSLKVANSVLSKNLDLIILDWMLPDGQGLDFLRTLRSQGNNVPVVFLTARTEVIDKVLGLELGANDYLTKPVDPRELIARIRVQLRNQCNVSETGKITVGSLSIDRVRHRVEFQNCRIELVKKEFDLLTLLAENPERVFSRDEILNKVWGYDVFPTTRTVDAHIVLLRQKIHSDLIETVRSVGYRLRIM